MKTYDLYQRNWCTARSAGPKCVFSSMRTIWPSAGTRAVAVEFS